MLTGIGPATPLARLLAAYVVFGLGFGFVNAPITNAAVSGMPRAQAGVAAAIATTSRQFGQTLGVAVVGAIVASHAALGGPLVGEPPGWWTLTACGAVVLVLGLVATTGAPTASARRTAAQLNPEALAACGMTRLPTPAREVWLLMSDLVLDNQRRREVSDALGMSFGRARAVRRLARRPMSMRELAARWASTRPTRPWSSTTSRPRASCAAGRIPPTGGPSSSRRRARARTWPAAPTRSSPRRRRRSAP